MNFTINTKHSNIFFRSTTSTTTTATEAIETQNEVIRSRSRSPNSDRGGRVKIRVRQKKRPFTTTAIPTTTFTKTLPQFAGESLALKITKNSVSKAVKNDTQGTQKLFQIRLKIISTGNPKAKKRSEAVRGLPNFLRLLGAL